MVARREDTMGWNVKWRDLNHDDINAHLARLADDDDEYNAIMERGVRERVSDEMLARLARNLDCGADGPGICGCLERAVAELIVDRHRATTDGRA